MGKKLFNFVIGNPPYQDETVGDQKTFAPPIYDKFMDAAYEICDRVELIHPARFLFNAGSTPRAWNRKMLEDPHFKILMYSANVGNIFPNANINGGVVISYRDADRNFGAIEIFSQFDELNHIRHKVCDTKSYVSLTSCVFSAYSYHFTRVLYKEHPDLFGRLSRGHEYDLKSNVFELMPEIFYEVAPSDGQSYIVILGRKGGFRTRMYIREDYVNDFVNLHKYKIIVSGADGAAGSLGNPVPARIVGTPTIECPNVGSTESFVSIGAFETEIIASHALKYIKSKFARVMLGVKKVTQAVTPEKWQYVPLQDFTPSSDIDWSKPVHDIDLQLYRKYGLDEKEIEFIETHVKEMA